MLLGTYQEFKKKAVRTFRYNPENREPDIKAPRISMPCGALEGLRKIDELL